MSTTCKDIKDHIVEHAILDVPTRREVLEIVSQGPLFTESGDYIIDDNGDFVVKEQI